MRQLPSPTALPGVSWQRGGHTAIYCWFDGNSTNLSTFGRQYEIVFVFLFWPLLLLSYAVTAAAAACTKKIDSFDFVVDYSGSMMMKKRSTEAG